MLAHPSGLRNTLLGLAVVGLAACGDSATAPVDHASLHKGAAPAAAGGNSANAAGLAKTVHAATSRFHSTTQALREGHLEDTHCVAVPGLGGMGHHWANPTLVDPVFDPLKPEVVLYAPDANGKMKLVGLEYIVINVGQPAPTFAGQAFDVGGAPPLGNTPHWTLHVWVHQENPAGMFARFNPTVSCPAP